MNSFKHSRWFKALPLVSGPRRSAVSSLRRNGLLALSLAALALPLRAQPAAIAIDFGKQTAESSYLLFGAASPNPRHAQVWETLAQTGVTSLRFDAWLGNGTEPQGITLEDYRANMGKPGTVADINSSHWNWSRIDGCLAICRRHGLTSLGILCYCPKWLAYGGDRHAPPRDFAVWKDLVRQIVRRYEGKIDYWEIWNEPNGAEFMKLKGTPYAEGKDGMLTAYLDICRHTLDAIRESGVKTRVGGPALATWNSALFHDKFLAHTDVASRLDFLSHHIYFHAPIPNRCYPPTIYELEKKHGIGPLPLFITEWNAKSSVDEKPYELKNTPAAVGWVGKSFVNFLQWGVQGAYFYNFHEGRALDDRYGGAYKLIDGQPQVFRYVKVFHLLSTVLGLGEHGGKIKVFDTRVAGLADELTLPPNYLDSLYAVGCVNARGVPVVVVANPSAVARAADLALAGLPAGEYRVRAYVVRPDHTPDEVTRATPLFEQTISTRAGAGPLTLEVGAHSVVGLRLERADSRS